MTTNENINIFICVNYEPLRVEILSSSKLTVSLPVKCFIILAQNIALKINVCPTFEFHTFCKFTTSA
jgi:hypothetical protein